MKVLNTNKKYCQGVLHTLYKKLTRSIKLFLMLFLFFGGNTLAAFAQNPCADVNGAAQLCLGAGNQEYTATSCQMSTYVFVVVNKFGSTATLVSSSGATAIVNPGTTTGTYTVHVAATQTSASGLMAEGSRSTAVNAIALSLAQQPVLCFGNNNGSVTATFSGANSYTIAIDGGGAVTQSSPYTFTGLSAGPHSVKVTGDNTCSTTKTITVGGPASALSSSKTSVNVLCFGGSTGSIDLSVAGGTTPYSYAWTASLGGVIPAGQAGNQDLSGLVAGTYSVTVTDANQCATTNSAVITQPAAPLSATSVFGNVNCFSTTSGTVTVTAAGGTPPYNYVIAGPTVNLTGATSGAFTGLTAGSYTVTVTDKNLCTAATTALVGSDPCIVCSYTQGFWGNKNGLNLLTSSGILNTPLVIGSTAIGKNSITITSGDIAKLNNSLPGGSTPGPLANIGACNISNTACFDANYLTGQGRINNNLLSQTITLALNARLGTILNNIPIQSGCLLTSAGAFKIDESVAAYLKCKNTATVLGLLSLANAVLGGDLTPGQVTGACTVPSYSAITNAVDAINNAFDECKNYNGYGACSTTLTASSTEVATTKVEISSYLKVKVSPNPYHDNVTFNIESNISGKAILEIFNLTGQKLNTVFEGNLSAGKGQNIQFSIPEQKRSNLIYRLRVGEKTTTGKILYMN